MKIMAEAFDAGVGKLRAGASAVDSAALGCRFVEPALPSESSDASCRIFRAEGKDTYDGGANESRDYAAYDASCPSEDRRGSDYSSAAATAVLVEM